MGGCEEWGLAVEDEEVFGKTSMFEHASGSTSGTRICVQHLYHEKYQRLAVLHY